MPGGPENASADLHPFSGVADFLFVMLMVCPFSRCLSAGHIGKCISLKLGFYHLLIHRGA
jgi:hypothetical protein